MYNKILLWLRLSRSRWRAIPSVGRSSALVIFAAGSLTALHAVVRHLSDHIHPFELVFFRSLFGFFAITPLLFRGSTTLLRSAQPKLQFLRGCLGMVAMFTWFYGLSLIPLAEATALSFTNAIFGALVATIFLGERLSGQRLIAILLGLIGVMIILRPGFVNWNVGTILVLFAALCWGSNVVIIKQLSRTDSAVLIVAWFGVQLSVLSLPFAIMVWTWPTWTDYLWLGLMGILATSGQFAITSGLKLVDSSAVFPLDFTRLLWAGLFGYIFFSEHPDVWTWIGAAIIIGGTVFFIRRESNT